MGRWELGGKQSVLAKVIPHIPTDSQEKKKAAKYSNQALGLFLAQRRETMTWWDNGWFLIVKQENEITFAHHWPVCPLHARVTLTQTLSLESSLTTLPGSALGECQDVMVQPVLFSPSIRAN